jgi:hypothetical protein
VASDVQRLGAGKKDVTAYALLGIAGVTCKRVTQGTSHSLRQATSVDVLKWSGE